MLAARAVRAAPDRSASVAPAEARRAPAGTLTSLELLRSLSVMLGLWVNQLLSDHGVEPDRAGGVVAKNEPVSVFQTSGSGTACLLWARRS